MGRVSFGKNTIYTIPSRLEAPTQYKMDIKNPSISPSGSSQHIRSEVETIIECFIGQTFSNIIGITSSEIQILKHSLEIIQELRFRNIRQDIYASNTKCTQKSENSSPSKSDMSIRESSNSTPTSKRDKPSEAEHTLNCIIAISNIIGLTDNEVDTLSQTVKIIGRCINLIDSCFRKPAE